MPSSHTRLYDKIDEPPLSGLLKAFHETLILVVEVPEERKGLVILAGTVLTVTPTILVTDTGPCPIMLIAEALT